MDRLARWLTGTILIVCVIAFALGYLLMDRGFQDMLLLTISLAVAAIPEGLPIVMTVALAVGVRRMARRHAIIRHLPAVETLGSTSTIISDKTGTLTQNRMVVQQIFAGNRQYHITGKAMSTSGEVRSDDDEKIDEIQDGSPLHFTLLAGLLNNGAKLKKSNGDDDGPQRGKSKAQHESPAKDNRQDDQKDEQSADDDQEVGDNGNAGLRPKGDPMEVALLISALKAGLSHEQLRDRYRQVDEVPFETERRFSATIHEVREGQGPLVLVKGAPEVILEMSDRMLNEEGQETDLNRDALEKKNEALASQGLRMLAMAIGRGDEAAKSIKSDEPTGMIFAGLQGLLDPPRPEAVEAVDNCHRAGIRVIMVTGDHARTAAAIAHACHIDRPVAGHENSAADSGDKGRGPDRNGDNGDALPETHTGQEIEKLSDEDVDALLKRSTVFARVKPNQKLRLVERLKAQNQIVAVTGDGVNDAPALKAAHLGVAMGLAGTDVAKEASDMVITDDNFASVYSAVEEGRTSFRNIRMATFFLLSTGVADVLIILVALALDWPLPLLPAQILWCNVVTNGIIDVALSFEEGDEELYRRPPRPPGEGILDRVLTERLVLISLWFTAVALAMFYWSYFIREDSIEQARVAALTTIVMFQIVHVFNCRSEHLSIFKKRLLSNKVLFLSMIGSLAVHVAALYIPWTQDILRFTPLPWDIWLVILLVSSTAIVVNELHKWFRRSAPADAQR